MRHFVLSPLAESDLDDVWDYSAEHWGLSQAERYIRMIQDTIMALAEGTHPSLSASHIRADYRRVLVGSHVLFFKETDDLIDIIRILHQRMDPTQHLSAH